MFTQCPACHTIFKLSAETLRAAGGEVRCGRCSEQFNALGSLAEEPQAFASPHAVEQDAPAAPRDAAPPPPVEAPAVRTPAEDGAPEGAHEDAHALTIADDPSLEFTLPPGELDRIFVEARPHHFIPRRGPLALSGLEGLEPGDPRTQQGGSSAGITPAAVAAIPQSAAATVIDTGPEADAPRGEEAESSPAPRNWIEQLVPTRHIEELDPPRQAHRGRWIAGGVVLALLLAVQLVHRYRDTLAQLPVAGAPLRSLYALTGHPIEPRLDLAAFEIRPWGVTGDTSADGTLHVRASLINNGSEPQPYPLLRLKLQDRFGSYVGARDFKPAEYLHPLPQHLLNPGERADLLLEIVDPGKSAEGFEIDVCERHSDGRTTCANDAPPGGRAP